MGPLASYDLTKSFAAACPSASEARHALLPAIKDMRHWSDPEAQTPPRSTAGSDAVLRRINSRPVRLLENLTLRHPRQHTR